MLRTALLLALFTILADAALILGHVYPIVPREGLSVGEAFFSLLEAGFISGVIGIILGTIIATALWFVRRFT